jgi:hypothetical protein
MLKKIAIVTMLTFLLLSLTGCVTTDSLPYNNCREMVVTYGDAVECMIQLDNALLTIVK